MDTEQSLRKAKDTAETQAVRAVNADLKDHINRLQQSLSKSTN